MLLGQALSRGWAPVLSHGVPALTGGCGGTGWATRGAGKPQDQNIPLPAGLRALSLTKRQAVTLAPSWPHGLVAAFEPYLVSVNKTSLLLWDRRTLALVLSVPAEGVQGAVAFVDLELPAGKRGWGSVPSVVPGVAGRPALFQAGAVPGCWGPSGLLLDVPGGRAAPNPGLCSSACASANNQRACAATPSTRDHYVEDKHDHCSKGRPNHHVRLASHLHHTTSTTQDHCCARHHSADHHQPVCANHNHPCTSRHHHHQPAHPNHDLCAGHHPHRSAQDHHEHHHHEHRHHRSVRASQARRPTANYNHAAPNRPCAGGAQRPARPAQPRTPPHRGPPSLLPSHTRALP